MLYRYELWDRFVHGKYWWMHLMVAVRLIFATLLFFIEPVVLHRIVRNHAVSEPRGTLKLMLRFQHFMWCYPCSAFFAAVEGSHGLV